MSDQPSENNPNEPKPKAPVSKLPSLEEVTSMAGKLFNDIKHSVVEIMSEYKEKRKNLYEEEAKKPTTNSNPKSPEKPLDDQPK
ncbi:MAG: hypothetical protein KIT27_04700 [Legionellales bacterium]|nr:hypothetical protein [Legionellales bacterium]